MFNDAHPQLRPWFQALYEAADRAGLRPRVTSVYRSLAEQQRLYDRYTSGRAALPAAPPGCSEHNFGLAIDMVVDDPRALGRAWQAVGGSWGGDRDPVHYGIGWSCRR